MGRKKKVEKEPEPEKVQNTEERKEVEITMELQVPLTSEEMSAAGKRAAAHYADLDKVESEKKSSNDIFKERIAATESHIRDEMLLINNGFEVRPVKCKRVYDFPANSVLTFRNDTGERIEERAMTGWEREEQLGLSLPDDPDQTGQGEKPDGQKETEEEEKCQTPNQSNS